MNSLYTHHKVLQTKLAIGAPNDRYEQEADRVADRVMRIPQTDVPIQRKCADCEEEEVQMKTIEPMISRIQRKCAECEEEEEALQMKPIQKKGQNGMNQRNATSDLASSLTAQKGRGQSLPSSTQESMSQAIGADFSQVNIHTGSQAIQMSQQLNARAFTHGQDIYFNSGEYQPQSSTGKHLLAHELTHVVQQGGAQNTIQAKYKLNELKPKKAGKIDSAPDSYFYPGSPGNTSDKKALIIAGIHAQEKSPCDLAKKVKDQLDAGTVKPDLHTIVIPCVVPFKAGERGIGTGTERVEDANRAFGDSKPSPNPEINKITTIVEEFDPDQTLSIHAVSKANLAGIFLDPKYSGKFPATGTEAEKKKAFTANPDNEAAMRLTEDMITEARRSEGTGTGFSTTGGNIPDKKSFTKTTSKKDPTTGAVTKSSKTTSVPFPQNEYPGGGKSPYSLLYPQQDQVDTSVKPTSLGTWMAGLGKTVITMELPGYAKAESTWKDMIPAVIRFMQLPGNRAYGPEVYTEDEKLQYLIGTLDSKKAGLTFGKKGDSIGLGKGNTPHKLGKNLNLRESSFRCLEAMMKDAKAAGHDISPFSGTRLFKDQKGIWEEKFTFTRTGKWGRLDPAALKKKYPKECAGIKDTETEWNSNGGTKNAEHKKCWEVLSDEEKAREILKTSSGPGFSRHHWGTDVDLNSDDPKKWETDADLIALYDWLQKNAHKYGYFESFNAGRPSGKGYTQEKWHWSFAPISVPLQEDYEQKVLKAGEAGRKLLEKEVAGVAGKDEALKLFKEYVETINPDLRGGKKIDRPACMPIGTGADIPSKAASTGAGAATSGAAAGTSGVPPLDLQNFMKAIELMMKFPLNLF